LAWSFLKYRNRQSGSDDFDLLEPGYTGILQLQGRGAIRGIQRAETEYPA